MINDDESLRAVALAVAITGGHLEEGQACEAGRMDSFPGDFCDSKRNEPGKLTWKPYLKGKPAINDGFPLPC